MDVHPEAGGSVAHGFDNVRLHSRADNIERTGDSQEEAT